MIQIFAGAKRDRLVSGVNEKSEGPAKTFSLKVIPCFSWAMDNKDWTHRSGEFLSEFGMAILKTEMGSRKKEIRILILPNATIA